MEQDIILALKNITKIYPGVVALDHVSVEFRRGEIHALCGENGAGKSTLIKVITGAIQPEEGSIVLDGTTYTLVSSDRLFACSAARIIFLLFGKM